MARHSQYPQIKVDEALLAYYTLGTYEKASAEAGVPWQTIAQWVTRTHKARYDELAAKHGPTLERQVVAKLAKTAERAADITDLSLEATRDALAQANAEPPDRGTYEEGEDGDKLYAIDWKMWAHLKANSAKDANSFSGAAKNSALVLGIMTDKKLTLEGRPTVITEHRDADDIIRSLSALGVIDGTASEIPTTQPSLNPATSTPDLRAMESQAEPNARETTPV